MASIHFLTRGHIEHVNKLIEHLKCQHFPMVFKYMVKNPVGEDTEVRETKYLEGTVRPIQLWEYVLPEEFVEPICKNLGIPTNETILDKEPGEQTGSFQSGFGIQAYLFALRKMLKAEKLPEIKPETKEWPVPIYKNHVNILGIGWRKDLVGEDSLGMKHELI